MKKLEAGTSKVLSDEEIGRVLMTVDQARLAVLQQVVRVGWEQRKRIVDAIKGGATVGEVVESEVLPHTTVEIISILELEERENGKTERKSGCLARKGPEGKRGQ